MLDNHTLSLFIGLLFGFNISNTGEFQGILSLLTDPQRSLLEELKKRSWITVKSTKRRLKGTCSPDLMDSIKNYVRTYISSFCDLKESPRVCNHPIHTPITQGSNLPPYVGALVAEYTGYNTSTESQRLLSTVDRLTHIEQRVSFSSLWKRLFQLSRTGNRNIKDVIIEAAFAQNEQVFLQLVRYGTGLQERDFKSMHILTREAYMNGHPEIYRHLVKMGFAIDSDINRYPFGGRTKLKTCLVPGSNGSDEEESDTEDDPDVDEEEESCNPPPRKKQKRVEHVKGPPCFNFRI